MNNNELYGNIKEIHLYKLKYNTNKKTKCIEEIVEKGQNLRYLLEQSFFDTSAIRKITEGMVNVDDFSNNNISNLSKRMLRGSFFTSLNNCDRRLASAIITLLDDSIEYIRCENQEYVRLKRYNSQELLISNSNLVSVLSSGIFRGVELYIRCIDAIKYEKLLLLMR